MPINAIFAKQLFGVLPQFRKNMNFIYLGSLLEVEDNHQAGLVIWKHFKCILKMGREGDIKLDFVYFQM